VKNAKEIMNMHRTGNVTRSVSEANVIYVKCQELRTEVRIKTKYAELYNPGNRVDYVLRDYNLNDSLLNGTLTKDLDDSKKKKIIMILENPQRKKKSNKNEYLPSYMVVEQNDGKWPHYPVKEITGTVWPVEIDIPSAATVVRVNEKRFKLKHPFMDPEIYVLKRKKDYKVGEIVPFVLTRISEQGPYAEILE
jgi:hypothetical protein